MRFWVTREHTFRANRKRGLGVWWTYGCMGTTYNEPGENMSAVVTVLLGWVEVALNWSWKRVRIEAEGK